MREPERATQLSMFMQTMEESYSGPLPHPDLLAKYDFLLPGAGRTIFELMVSQTEHRQTLEKAAITANIEVQKRGQWFALIVVLAALAVSAILGLTDHEAAAIGIGGTSIVGLAAVFITGRWRQEKERDKTR